MLKAFLLVGAGSFLGGGLRFLTGRYLVSRLGHHFPWGTIGVNLIGCFLLGFFLSLFGKGQLQDNPLKLFLTVGFCGGFTTFSTFVNESFLLGFDRGFLPLFLNLAISLLGGFLALYAGYRIG